jgi:hypothetical protein
VVGRGRVQRARLRSLALMSALCVAHLPCMNANESLSARLHSDQLMNGISNEVEGSEYIFLK